MEVVHVHLNQAADKSTLLSRVTACVSKLSLLPSNGVCYILRRKAGCWRKFVLKKYTKIIRKQAQNGDFN